MGTASLLIALILAGQAGWMPERSASPPASAPTDDRYAQQSSTETNRSPQTSNPFGTPTAQAPPAANSRARSAVAPPPWSGSSTTNAPDWDDNENEFGSSFGQTASPGLLPLRTESGWTSIGSLVAAPPLGVPALTTTTNTKPTGDAPLGGLRSTAPTPGRYDAPPASGADSWATGWGNESTAGQATISRSADPSDRFAANGNAAIQGQTSNSRPSAAPSQSNNASNNWADLWGDKDPWADPPQTSTAATPTTQAPASTAHPAPTNPNLPFLAAPSNNLNGAPAAVAPVIVEPVAPSLTVQGKSFPPTAAGEQQPWLPLLVVSLSLAGSLGANLFLGWSYLDARQRYSGLVRKTADKFRRAAAAAA